MGQVERDLAVVQFSHPGGEHDPGDVTEMEWNIGEHRRKFLRCPGRYLDADGVKRSGTVTFWGEWEAQSRVVGRYPDAGAGMPRFVHEPFVQRPHDMRARRQNTDPFVFGDAFLYSNCRQFTPTQHPSHMQRLARGSIILFGSTLDDQFVLDTVVVTGNATPYVIGEPDPGDDMSEVFRAATLEPLAASKRAGTAATLYRGVMHGPGQQEMFSFVPAAGDGGPFARPVIELPPFVNPASWQSAKTTAVSAAEARAAWDDVAGEVRAQGLDLSVFLAEPEIIPGYAGITPGALTQAARGESRDCGGKASVPAVTRSARPDVAEDVRKQVQAAIDADGAFRTAGDVAAFVCR